jgi:hypothetical protein
MKQFDLDRETDIVFSMIASDSAKELSSSPAFYEYLNLLFKDLNANYRDIKSAHTLTKGLLVAETLLYTLKQGKVNEPLKL